MIKSCSTMVLRRGLRVCLAAALAVAGLAAVSERAGRAADGDFGTIKGRLVWGGSEAPAPKNLVEKGQSTKDPAVCAVDGAIVDRTLTVDPKTKGVRYAFVYLVKPSGENPDAVKALVAKKATVEIDNKNCEFVPYVTAVHEDQSVVFKSSDPVNHNVHLSPFTNDAFNAIIAPNGEITKKFVAEKRVIPLTCDIHPWMKGYVMVFDHPFFAVTAEDGSFEIKGVPAGDQNLVIWQAAVGYVNAGLARGMPVTVTAGKATDLGDVELDPAKVK